MQTNKIIGEKLRELREIKNLTIDEVAERTRVSAEQIQRFEGNEETPSMTLLIKIARILGIRLGSLLDDQQEIGPVVCRKSMREKEEGLFFSNTSQPANKKMSYFALSPDKSGCHMEPFLIHVMPEKNVDFVFSTHEGEEFIYVVKGVIEINYGETSYILEEGDSIYYDSIVAHHVHAGNEHPATILGVIYTPC